MSSEETSQLFWLQYGEAIKNIAGVGSDKMFFLSSESQKGPLAGTNIPKEYTGAGLYAIANNILSTGDVFYSPSARRGYQQALDTYLNWVDLGGKSSPGLDAAFLDAVADQRASQAALDSEADRAEASWTRDVKRGLIDMPFAVWLDMGNAPGYTAAKQQADSIAQRIMQIQLQMGGPIANAVEADRDNLSRGRSMGTDFPGYNMRVASGANLSNAELLNKERSGERIADPLTVFVPLYNSPESQTFVQDAVKQAISGDYSSAQRMQVGVDIDKDTSDYNFGQPEGASVSDRTPWFSFRESFGELFEDSTLDTGSESSEVEVIVTYNDIRAVTIQPGNWNIDLSKYKLRSDAPKEVKRLSRASQVIVVAGLGFEITVGESTAETLESELEQATNAGHSINVFGITIDLGDAKNNTHRTSWDKEARTFKVVPDFDNNVTTVVGAVASLLQ